MLPASCCAAPGRAGRRSTRWSRTAAADESADVGPDEPCLILFTSGTTSGAKAAVHSSRTLLAETRQLADAWGLSWEDVAYMAAPLQHITGVLNAMTIPLLVGASAVLSERWDADAAVADIMRHRVTYSAGATVFLQELTDAARAARVHLPLRMFACGGAAVPRAVMERSEEQGIPAARVYGMTELPTVTVMNRAYPFDLRAETDGAIAPGVQVRVVGTDGEPLAAGMRGRAAGARARADAGLSRRLRPTGPPSMTRAGSPPGTSASSMPPASSPSPAGSRT